MQPNLEREREGHDDVCNHNILQIYNKVGLRGDAKKHPCSHTIEAQPKQEENRVENREDHSLQHVVAGAGAVGLAVIASYQRKSCISLHEGRLKHTEKRLNMSMKWPRKCPDTFGGFFKWKEESE